MLTHLFFPGCVNLVGDLAHLERSPSHPPYVPLKYKNFFGHKGGRRERLGAVKHAKRCRISARFFLEGSRGLENSIKKGPGPHRAHRALKGQGSHRARGAHGVQKRKNKNKSGPKLINPGLK